MKTFEDLNFRLSPSEDEKTITIQLENGYSMEITQFDHLNYLLSDPHYKWDLAINKDGEQQELFLYLSKDEVSERMKDVQTTDKYIVKIKF